MRRLMQTRLAKLAAHKGAQGPIQRVPCVERDAAALDGEAVAYGEANYDFHALRSRNGARHACLIAFDLIEMDGEDRRGWPVEDRRARLRALLEAPPDGIQFSEAIEGDGPAVYEQAARMGLEGIVSKRLGSRYRSGQCTDWLKTKNPAYERA